MVQASEYTPDEAAESVSRALDSLKKELPPLENIIAAFREIFVEKARLKAEISPGQEPDIGLPDTARFEQGAPLLTSWADLVDCDGAMWMKAADRLIPAMEKGFPQLTGEIRKLKQALEQRELDPRAFVKAMAADHPEEMEAIASPMDIEPRTIGFLLRQIMKPLAEKKAELLKPLIKDLVWRKGYCPICGSMPELAYLRGKEGRKWLRCSLCANEWRFGRLVCPFCENNEREELLAYYIADRDRERVEVCQQCKRYVPSLDLRDRSSEPLLEVAALGLVHLDVLAQQNGFLPAAICAWNLVATEAVMPSASDTALQERTSQTKTQ